MKAKPFVISTRKRCWRPGDEAFPHGSLVSLADNGLFHCHSQPQAREICDVLRRRFRECGLALHPQKTKIVYGKDGQRRGSYPGTTFDCLGYTFRGRTTRGARGELCFSFHPAVSTAALKSMRHRVRKSNLRNRADRDREEIAREFNPGLQGWLNYYGRFNRSALYAFLRYFNHPLRAWVIPLSREADQSGTVLGTDGQGSP